MKKKKQESVKRWMNLVYTSVRIKSIWYLKCLGKLTIICLNLSLINFPKVALTQGFLLTDLELSSIQSGTHDNNLELRVLLSNLLQQAHQDVCSQRALVGLVKDYHPIIFQQGVWHTLTQQHTVCHVPVTKEGKYTLWMNEQMHAERVQWVIPKFFPSQTWILLFKYLIIINANSVFYALQAAWACTSSRRKGVGPALRRV